MAREMEGGNRQRRAKAREARKRGRLPSEEGVPFGASKQRHRADKGDHVERIHAIRRGKQEVIAQNTPEPRPGSRTED